MKHPRNLGWLGLLLLGLLPQASAFELEGLGSFAFEPLTERVWVMHGPLGEPSKANLGFMNNPALVESTNGLILVDPGGSHPAGQKVVEEIRKVSAKPVLAVFNTHIHGDHWLANQAVVEAWPDAVIYGHPRMIEKAKGNEGLRWLDLMSRLTEGTSDPTRIVPPRNSVDDGTELVVDGETFRILHHGAAHTDTDIVILHPASGTAFLGDNAFESRFGQFEEGASIYGNIEILEHVAGLDMQHFVPGHGRSGAAEMAFQPFLEYLKLLQEAVAEGFDQGLMDYEIRDLLAPKLVAFGDWEGFEANLGKHVSRMYLEHEARSL